MTYSRRFWELLSIGILAGMPAAMAQDYPQTLDQQMQAQQPSRLPPSVPPDAVREWPGNPSMATGPETGADNDGGYDAIDSEGGGAIPSLPLEVQSMNGVTFITGGVGDEEVAQLKASEHQYNLHLLMTSEHGAFIGNVTVTIKDAGGNAIVTAQDAGPYFYARLPEGKYTVELSEDGENKTFTARITPRHSNIKKVVAFHEPGGIITPHQPTETVE